MSKGLLVSSNSPKKQTKEFVFTTTTNLFVRFLGEFEDTKKSFRNYLTFRFFLCNLSILDFLNTWTVNFSVVWISLLSFLNARNLTSFKPIFLNALLFQAEFVPGVYFEHSSLARTLEMRVLPALFLPFEGSECCGV